MKTASFILILLFVLSISCSTEKAEITQRYQDGKKKILCIYSGSREPRKLLRRISYNRNGRVIKTENFADNTMILFQWHKNGERKSESRFKDGNKQREWRQWYSTGGLKTEKVFNHGKLVRSASYKRDIIEEIIYKDGELYIQRQFKDGIISTEKTFQGGKLINAKYYYPDGKLSDERGYKDNKKHGRWVYRDRNGKILSDILYNEGEVVTYSGNR
jgi:antitoxin component YwqK of YwqJK toxin-antitoxin module